MPRWIARVVWAMRGKRRVRLHIERRDGSDFTMEGILIGRWSGQHVLLMPKIVESPESTVTLEGSVEVPSEHVLFCQVLG